MDNWSEIAKGRYSEVLSNVGKCQWNRDIKYIMGHNLLGKTIKEKDFGAMVSVYVEVSVQHGMTRINNTIKKRYNAIVTPRFE